jgi:hypothetical protein
MNRPRALAIASWLSIAALGATLTWQDQHTETVWPPLIVELVTGLVVATLSLRLAIAQRAWGVTAAAGTSLLLLSTVLLLFVRVAMVQY